MAFHFLSKTDACHEHKLESEYQATVFSTERQVQKKNQETVNNHLCHPHSYSQWMLHQRKHLFSQEQKMIIFHPNKMKSL
jgi:hypothetical protein